VGTPSGESLYWMDGVSDGLGVTGWKIPSVPWFGGCFQGGWSLS